ncbi:MAG TPA: ketopantoate reductase C-terminal domain-containing protein, partial [Burkholderiaceae bacterium]
LNLNNAVNALSGQPLKTQLSQRAYRRCLADLIEETLAILTVAGIEPARITRINPYRLPMLLRLPDFVFTRIAAAMLRIDPEARSSMWEDMQAGRRTEVDYLNGAVVAMARSLGRAAPLNSRMVELVRQAEAGSLGSLSGEALFAALHRST